MSPELGARTIAKVTRRLVPFSMLLFVLSYLDRVNVGFAALQMNEDLGFSPTVYGLGAGIFFLGFFPFEIPSNLIMQRVGARRWMARIMIAWGAIATGMAWISGATSFYIMRFLLGVAEAGLLPGIIFYFSYWFPAKERARALALFMSSTAISNMIGAPLSTSPVRFLSRPMHRATLSLTNPCGLLQSLSPLQHQYHTTRPSRIKATRQL